MEQSKLQVHPIAVEFYMQTIHNLEVADL